jgi:hypothetical protein
MNNTFEGLAWITEGAFVKILQVIMSLKSDCTRNLCFNEQK